MVHGDKLQELIVYIGKHPKVENLGLTKLWKLIYFVDAKSMRDLGESITGSEFIKYEHGPVPSRGEKSLKALKRNGTIETEARQIGNMTVTEVKPTRPAKADVFSSDQLEVIDEICSEFGKKNAGILSNLTHKEPAWHYATMREKLSPELMMYGAEEDDDGL